MNTTTERPKRKTNGQYSHGWDKVCTCGKTKGEHTAEAPFEIDDADHQCPGFKKAK